MGDRTPFTTTLDNELLDLLRIKAIHEKKNVNDILEGLIKKYLSGEIRIDLQK